MLGIQINDNNLIVYEFILFLRRKDRGKKEFMSIKLDMIKTDDRVKWDYLEHTLSVMGFPPQFTHIIM